MSPRPLLMACALTVASLGVGACAGTESDPATTEITVFAASSLAGSFADIAAEFESVNPGVSIRINVGGSADLFAQIQEGAPVDVFASADEATMARLEDPRAQSAQVFATNTLQIAVPPDNPAGITAFADLDDATLNLVVCAPQVPCGAAAQRAATAAGVTLAPVSEEQSVADVLGKVTSGEADAGLVYGTDILAAAAAVRGIEFPESSAAVNRYPITVISSDAPEAERRDAAAEFVDFVLGPIGQTVLAQAGFGPP
jgi:molybdate transport system substrate-binding protein